MILYLIVTYLIGFGAILNISAKGKPDITDWFIFLISPILIPLLIGQILNEI